MNASAKKNKNHDGTSVMLFGAFTKLLALSEIAVGKYVPEIIDKYLKSP